MWLQQFKIALAQQNSDSISKLLDEIPTFKSTSQMKEAQYLLAQALELISQFKDETAQTLSQIKQNRDYFASMNTSKSSKLDVST
ncbi:MAG: hypothetical protein U9P71_07385 [Campylobacterota bacterium]|nr:hypothetical protein [Campylobacterota bacterium]